MANNFLFNSDKKTNNSSVKSQRQLKVGEELRHLISNALLRESFYDEHIKNNNITITEVNVSPDLKNAKVYVMPLGGKNKPDVINSLSKATGRLRKIISNSISLRQTPKLSFKIDETFENAKKIHDILDKIKK
tara:strand:- start:23 stop:421 length:399 start_codon:yes stop_codon:yes gene_type:complete